MKTIFVVLAATLFLYACTDHPYAKASPYGTISMVSLLTHPSAFEGQQIEVMGYLVHGAGFELYLDEIRASLADDDSAVLVAPVSAEFIYNNCSNRYVRIRGTVRVTPPLVTLTDVVNIQDARTVTDCWNRQIEEASGADYSTP